MLTRHIAASIFSLAICAMPLAAACDADDANLAGEVDRLQAENDALRSAARLSVVAPIDAPAPPVITPREQGKPWQKYLPTAEVQDTMSAIMKACGAKPITISSSGWDPDATTSDDQVLSLAYSYMGGAKARACLDAEMDKRGAVSL